MTPIDFFQEYLPQKPYCCDNLFDGLSVRPRQTAIKKNYIQANGPTHKRWMIFDVDSRSAGIDWYDQNAPTPNLVISNPANGHAHLLYCLHTPVRTADRARRKPLKYAAAIELALRKKLKGDAGYGGLICKNPFSPKWIVKEWESELYSLDLLADYVDLTQPIIKEKEDTSGLGRNCELFDALTHYAVRARRVSGWDSSNAFDSDIFEQAMNYNETVFRRCPLPIGEIKSIAKSVTKWACSHVTKSGFSEWQSVQGQKGGKVSKGGGRPSLNEPWKAEGISRATYFRRKKSLIQK